VAMLEVNNPKTHFRTRCPCTTEACGHEEPVWRKVSLEHRVATYHWTN